MTTSDRAPAVLDPGDHTADLAALRRVIADVEIGLNTNDATLMTRHFADNAVAVGVDGRATVGSAALREVHERAVAPGGFLRDQYTRYEAVDVSFVRPDVALLRKHAHAVDRDGTVIDVGHAMCALYVLTREQGRWWIVARQNALVPTVSTRPGAPPSALGSTG